MSKVSPEVVAIMRKALEVYLSEVRDSRLKDSVKKMYSRDAEYFVRWLDDDFEPGANVL